MTTHLGGMKTLNIVASLVQLGVGLALAVVGLAIVISVVSA